MPLEPKYILAALQDLDPSTEGLKSEARIREKLTECAEASLNGLVRRELEQNANSLLVSAIKTAVSREEAEIASALRRAIEESQFRISETLDGELAIDALSKSEKFARNRFSQDLKSDKWLTSFRGRDILNCFVDRHVKVVKYEVFRNLIVARMRDDNYEPPGMYRVIEEILNA